MLIAAVTGASRGIGRATALELSGAGYRVFALARAEADLASLSAEAKRSGGEIVPLLMDIALDEARTQAAQMIMAATNGYGVDLLVNNAGYGLLGPVEEVTLAQLRHQFEVNVVGLLAFTQPFIPAMRARRQGRIVNLSSAAGRLSSPFMGAYSASKFALEGLSDALRVELQPFGVQVILIEPGPIRSNFGADAVRHANTDSPYSRLQRRWEYARSGSNLLERSPESVARLILGVARARHPRPRYTITLSAKGGTVARRLLPDRVMDWLFRHAIEG